MKHNLDIKLTNYLLKLKNSPNIIEGIRSSLTLPTNYWLDLAPELYRDPVMSYDKKYHQKIIEVLKKQNDLGVDIKQNFETIYEKLPLLKQWAVPINNRYKFSINLPNNTKKYFYTYDNTQKFDSSTWKLKYPNELSIDFYPDPIKIKTLEKISTSDHIKWLSAPIIDYIQTGQQITKSTSPLTEKQISTTVENYLNNPNKFRPTWVNLPKNIPSNLFNAADEISTGLLILLSEMVAVGYGM